jgi:hypothetical protein
VGAPPGVSGNKRRVMEIFLLVIGLWIVGAIVAVIVFSGGSLGRTDKEQYWEDEIQMRELARNRDRET